MIIKLNMPNSWIIKLFIIFYTNVFVLDCCEGGISSVYLKSYKMIMINLNFYN